MLRIQVTGEVLGKTLNFGIDMDVEMATAELLVEGYLKPMLDQILKETEWKVLGEPAA